MKKRPFKKYTRILSAQKLLRDYLDVMGVLDGAYAYKGPNFAQIDLTNNCNNDCIGCWCNSPLLEEKKIDAEVKNKSIPFARAVRLIDELRAMGTRHVYYAGGGEPFMHPRIMDIIAHTKKRGLVCYINTNFTLVDEQRVRTLVDLNVDHLTVSVWAGTPQVYTATHPNKTEETFFKIKEMLQLLNRLKRRHPVVKLYNVIFNMNYHDVETMIDFALQTNSETVEFTVIDTIPGKTDSLLLDDAERQSLVERCGNIQEKYGNGAFKNRIQLLGFDQFIRRVSHAGARSAEYDSNVIATMPCYAGWSFVRILADGNVNSCLKSHRFPVGNILSQDFRTIWNGSLQQYFRKKTRNMEKDDAFFSLIGNDPNARIGCHKSCDNMGHNMDLHGKFSSLNRFERKLLEGVTHIGKTLRNV